MQSGLPSGAIRWHRPNDAEDSLAITDSGDSPVNWLRKQLAGQ